MRRGLTSETTARSDSSSAQSSDRCLPVGPPEKTRRLALRVAMDVSQERLVHARSLRRFLYGKDRPPQQHSQHCPRAEGKVVSLG